MVSGLTERLRDSGGPIWGVEIPELRVFVISLGLFPGLVSAQTEPRPVLVTRLTLYTV